MAGSMTGRAVAMLVVIAAVVAVISPIDVKAWTPQQNYVRDPAYIPRFANYTNPTLEPGESGKISFAIKNRYNDSMNGVVLTIEIYELGTIEYSKRIDKVHNPPEISDSVNKQSLVLNLNTILSGSTLVKEFTIKTSRETEEGTYFVRFNLSFTFNSDKYTMLSRGYFSDADWTFATKESNKTNADKTHIDMEYLYQKYGSIAIIPDTAFTVRWPIPMWPFYILAGLTVMFAVLAVIFYLQEEHGKFPRLEKALQKWSGKLHQSRRLLKKRAGKV